MGGDGGGGGDACPGRSVDGDDWAVTFAQATLLDLAKVNGVVYVAGRAAGGVIDGVPGLPGGDRLFVATFAPSGCLTSVHDLGPSPNAEEKVRFSHGVGQLLVVWSRAQAENNNNEVLCVADAASLGALSAGCTEDALLECTTKSGNKRFLEVGVATVSGQVVASFHAGSSGQISCSTPGTLEDEPVLGSGYLLVAGAPPSLVPVGSSTLRLRTSGEGTSLRVAGHCLSGGSKPGGSMVDILCVPNGTSQLFMAAFDPTNGFYEPEDLTGATHQQTNPISMEAIPSLAGAIFTYRENVDFQLAWRLGGKSIAFEATNATVTPRSAEPDGSDVVVAGWLDGSVEESLVCPGECRRSAFWGVLSSSAGIIDGAVLTMDQDSDGSTSVANAAVPDGNRVLVGGAYEGGRIVLGSLVTVEASAVPALFLASLARQ
jgi:hypothetical protein